MLKFTSIVGYTSCGPTYIESFLTIFGQCINVLNNKDDYTTTLSTLLDKFNRSSKKCFIAGDFNIDLFNFKKQS